MTKRKSLSAKIMKPKLVPWQKIVTKKIFSLEKESRAAVVMDQYNKPYLFLFDTAALLDVLSEIDEKLVDRFSPEDYYFKDNNPAGWLIDEIECKLPLNPSYIKSLKNAIKEANKTGWVSIEKIEKDLKHV